MCIFSEEVDDVSNTKIFITELPNGKQITVYKNTVQFARKVGGKIMYPAMILPFPNDGSVTPKTEVMWNMAGYEHFFDDCAECFPKQVTRSMNKSVGTDFDDDTWESDSLPIHECGKYQYCVVSDFAKFAALDYDHFGLNPFSEALLSRLQMRYPGFGFVICAYTAEGEIPPVAFIHPRMPNGKMFVPTMHIHNGDAEEKFGDWDHEIYVLNNASKVVRSSYATESLYTIGDKNPVGYTLSVSPATDLRGKFNFKRLPVGFPTQTIGEGSQFIKLRITGTQNNGDLAFFSSVAFARCNFTKQCTRVLTGDEFAIQQTWMCHTCFRDDTNKCICVTCRDKHRKLGHAVSEQNSVNLLGSFCDDNLITNPVKVVYQ